MRARNAVRLGIPLLFALAMLLSYPVYERFDFGADEGFNLMKAFLVADGHSLYSDIWSDQPPLFTFVLAGAQSLFGAEVETGRFLVLAFSVLLLWSAWGILVSISGRVAAVTGVLLLVALPGYIRLSVSVLIGLPAISLATLSVWALVRWHRTRHPGWVVLSAAALAASILTKLFTGILVPVCAVGVLLGCLTREGPRRRRLGPFVLWGTIFAGSLGLAYLAFVGRGALPQLIGTHLRTRATNSGFPNVLWHLRPSAALLALAAAGVGVEIRRRSRASLYLAAWAALGLLALLTHRPVWPHQCLLVTVPAAMLAACAVAGAWRGLRSRSWRRAPVGLAACVLVAVGLGLVWHQQLPIARKFFRSGDRNPPARPGPWSYGLPIVAAMQRHAPRTRTVVTESPMYAYRAGLPVPPLLAVPTGKRPEVRTGRLVLECIRAERPEQVLILRHDWPEVLALLREEYEAVPFAEGVVLHLRKGMNLR